MPGRFGVWLVIGMAAVGAVATLITGHDPGYLLGGFVLVGTVLAALAVRPKAAYMIIPAPALTYACAALAAGVVHDKAAGASRTALAVGAAQWIGNGFLPLTAATLLAIIVAVVRWSNVRRSSPPVLGPGAGPHPGNLYPGSQDDWSARPRVDDRSLTEPWYSRTQRLEPDQPSAREVSAPPPASRYPDSPYPDSRTPDSEYPGSQHPRSQYPDAPYRDAPHPASPHRGSPHPGSAHRDTPYPDLQATDPQYPDSPTNASSAPKYTDTPYSDPQYPAMDLPGVEPPSGGSLDR